MLIERLYFCSIIFLFGGVLVLIGFFNFLGTINGLPTLLQKLYYFTYAGYVLFVISLLFLFKINKRFRSAFATSIVMVVVDGLALIFRLFTENDILFLLSESLEFSGFILSLLFYVYVVLGFSTLLFEEFNVDVRKKLRHLLIAILILYISSGISSIITSLYELLKNYWVNLVFTNLVSALGLAVGGIVLAISIILIKRTIEIRKGIIENG